LVFIEKLQNNDLMRTSFAALRRPNYDIWRFHGWPISCFGLSSQKKFPAYKFTRFLNDIRNHSQEIYQTLKCPRVNHSITSLRPPCDRPGIPSRGPASLWVISSVSKWVGTGGGTMGQFSPWPKFISIIDNTYILYTSYAYLFVIRSDRISRPPRNPLSVCLTHISDSSPYLIISFNSGKLGCIQIIQVSSGKFR
jgi:hypothetical protein